MYGPFDSDSLESKTKLPFPEDVFDEKFSEKDPSIKKETSHFEDERSNLNNENKELEEEIIIISEIFLLIIIFYFCFWFII